MSTDDAYKKRKKAFFHDYKRNKNVKWTNVLTAGLRGFMLTCNNHEESRCIKEAYDLLNATVDQLFGSQAPAGASSSAAAAEAAADDVEAELEAELQAIGSSPKRFSQVKTNVKNVLFIRCADPAVDPNRVVASIFERIEATKKQLTRHLLRMVPVTVTCAVGEVESAVEDLLGRVSDGRNLAAEEEAQEAGKTWKVECRVRNNSQCQRLQLVDAIAATVSRLKPDWRVDLDQPQLVLVVDVLNTVCCLNLVDRYQHFSRYNLVEFAKKVAKGDETTTMKTEEEADQTPADQ